MATAQPWGGWDPGEPGTSTPWPRPPAVVRPSGSGAEDGPLRLPTQENLVDSLEHALPHLLCALNFERLQWPFLISSHQPWTSARGTPAKTLAPLSWSRSPSASPRGLRSPKGGSPADGGLRARRRQLESSREATENFLRKVLLAQEINCGGWKKEPAPCRALWRLSS